MHQILKTWLYILTHPREATFENELQKGHASWGKALVWLTVAVVALALLNAASTYFVESFFSSFVGAREITIVRILEQVGIAYDREQVLLFVGSPLGGSAIALSSTLVLAPLVLAVGIGLCFGLARAMGGNGSLQEHTYLFASFISPIMLIGGLFGFVPCVGLLALIALWVLALVLAYFAVKALHQLSAGKTLTAILVPYLILTLLLVVTNPPSI